MTAGGDGSGRCATQLAPPLPSPSRRGRRGAGRRPRSLAPETPSPLRPAPAALRAFGPRARRGLVYSAPLVAAGGPVPALGPISQMEKLTQEP